MQVPDRLSDHSLSMVDTGFELPLGDTAPREQGRINLTQVLWSKDRTRWAAEIPKLQGLSKHLAA